MRADMSGVRGCQNRQPADERVDAIIGVHTWERRILQKLIIDLDAEHDTSVAGHSDDLRHTLDYSAMANTIRSVCARGERELLEALAQDIIEALFAEHGIVRARLTIAKPGAVAGAAAVGIRILRERPIDGVSPATRGGDGQ